MNPKIDFEKLLEQSQDCYSFKGEAASSYFSFLYKELVKREGETGKEEIPSTIFSFFLNLPFFIGERIHKIFFKDGFKKDSFLKGMQQLYFGSFETICEITFEIFDLSDSEVIFASDVLLILNYLTLDIKINASLRELVTNFFDGKETLDFYEFVEIISMKNSDVLVLLLLSIYDTQPFSEKSLNNFNNYFDFRKNAYTTSDSSNDSNSTNVNNSALTLKPVVKYQLVKPSFDFYLTYENGKKQTQIQTNEEEASAVIDFSEVTDLNEIWEKIKFNDEKEFDLGYANFDSNRKQTSSTEINSFAKENKNKEPLIVYTFENDVKKSYQLELVDQTLILCRRHNETYKLTVSQVIPLTSLFAHVDENIKCENQIFSPLILTNKCLFTKNERVFYFKSVLDRNSLFETLCGKEIMNIRKINYNFIIKKEVGRGKYGKVSLALNVHTDEQVAIKRIKKNKLDKHDKYLLAGELDVMKFLIKNRHENIVNTLDIYETRKHIYIVMEYCGAGDLDFLLTNEEKMNRELNSSSKKLVSKQIANGIQFLHSNGIVHRDIKPGNILVENENEKLVAKVSDFGFSKFVGRSQLVNESCGSLIFAAPEIFTKKYYGKTVDTWSYGIILFYLYFGDYPFIEPFMSKEQIVRQICYRQFVFREERRKNPEVEKLITECLPKNFEERLTIEQVLKSKLFIN